jgi:hypothetical protein
MNTTMLTRTRVCNVYSGNRKDMCGLRFPAATLGENRDTRTNDAVQIADVCVMGVTFRSPCSLIPGKVHYLSAKAHDDGSALVSAVRVVSCRVRADGDFDVSAEFF